MLESSEERPRMKINFVSDVSIGAALIERFIFAPALAVVRLVNQH